MHLNETHVLTTLSAPISIRLLQKDAEALNLTMSHHWCCNLEEGSKTTVTEIFCMSVCLWEVDPLKLTIYPGPAIRRTMRQWGRTTLRTGRLWGHILWGNCEPKNVCPQSRIQMRLWGQNWQNLQNKLQKYWIYDANTWGWVFLLDICCKHLEKICNFEGFCGWGIVLY